MRAVCLWISAAQAPWLYHQQRGGRKLLALGDINIKASYINANGTIQSGVKSYSITIPASGTADGKLNITTDGTAVFRLQRRNNGLYL